MLLALSMGGCTTSIKDMRFVQDHRVRFTAPDRMAETGLPATFSWDSELPAGQRYALFIGGDPIAPGRSLRDLAERDPQCLARPACPDAEYLQTINVYVTDQTSVTVENFPTPGRGSKILQAQLVLLGPDGRRQGESSWFIPFKLEGLL